MQRRYLPTASLPRDRAFWASVSVLLVGQLIAFWTVCSQQVRMAEVRHESAQVETLVVRACMHSVPNATLASCMQRVAPQDQQDVAIAGPSSTPQNTAAEPPVNSVYH